MEARTELEAMVAEAIVAVVTIAVAGALKVAVALVLEEVEAAERARRTAQPSSPT